MMVELSEMEHFMGSLTPHEGKVVRVLRYFGKPMTVDDIALWSGLKKYEVHRAILSLSSDERDEGEIVAPCTYQFTKIGREKVWSW